MRTFFITPLVIFLIFVMIMLAKLIGSDEKKPSLLIGKPLPEFTLKAAFEDMPQLKSADLKGKYTLVNIFGSWCLTCWLEHPLLMKLKEDNVIEIYGIAWRDKTEALREFLKQKGNPYTNVGEDFEGKTVIELGVTAAPESFLISPDGIIVASHAGPISEDVWQSTFLPFIKGEKK